jgi:hypothetical protein
MYLKECLEIIQNVFKDNPSKEEQIVLINILKYINENICLSDYRDKSNKKDNEFYLNYTNKFYMMNNDNKTTKLLNLMLIIYKINNPDINNAYFDLITNIYCFQFTYNNFYWPMYSFLEPLLVNIDTKSYSKISNEISFIKFQLDLINYLNAKESLILKQHPNMLKNGFYFGDKNTNGIYAEIGNMPDNIIITFGFKLVIKNEPEEKEKQKEYILVQFKDKDTSLLKISIVNHSGTFFLSLFTTLKQEEHKEYDRTEIIPYKYYIFSFIFKQSKCSIRFICDEIPCQIFFELHKEINFKPVNNLFLCVGCDIKFNDDLKKIYKCEKKFTGFIGDVHIINSEGFNIMEKENKDEQNNKTDKKDKKDKNAKNEKNEKQQKQQKIQKKVNERDLQEIIVNLKGKYGNAIVKSISGQMNLDEYIISHVEEITKTLDKKDINDYFNQQISKDNIKLYKIIDNVALFISSYNFKLINYMDNIDYLNHDNLYSDREEDLEDIKKEYQYIHNLRVTKKNVEDKAIEINTKLFNCNFNIP